MRASRNINIYSTTVLMAKSVVKDACLCNMIGVSLWRDMEDGICYHKEFPHRGLWEGWSSRTLLLYETIFQFQLENNENTYDYFNLYLENILFQLTDFKGKCWGRFQGSFFRINLEEYNFVLSIDKWTRGNINIKLFSWT